MSAPLSSTALILQTVKGIVTDLHVVLVAAKEFTGTRLLSSILQQIKISSLPCMQVKTLPSMLEP